MRLRTDPGIRQALYGLYIALFQAKTICPNDFPDGRLTTILTAIMGIENLGWRVVGITKEALDLLALEDFRKNRLPNRLCRGHVINRIQTARLLFEGGKPMSLDAFFDKFLQNDRTVIMLKEQNSHAKPFPNYIEIDNPDGKLFPNASKVSWKHRQKERDYLRSVQQIEACRAYARMINNLDYRAFEPWLADDFHYESQWVFDEITSKVAYEAYIVPKLQTIRSSDSRVWAELAFDHKYGGGPCVVFAQGERDELRATLLVTMRADKISRADLCLVPAPGDCERTGGVPT